jgi:hypothetical protein
LSKKGEFEEWYKKKCLYGDWRTCGIKKLGFCPNELNGINEQLIEWTHHTLEKTTTKNGKFLKKLNLVFKKTTLDEFIDYLKPKLQHSVRHNFVARWQDQHLKACVKAIPLDSMVSKMDFVKNYSFQVQNEVHNIHWHSF